MLCPANLLGYLFAIHLDVPGASSFRAECPVLLSLREAPGHAVEESLFDVTTGNTPTKIGPLGLCSSPRLHGLRLFGVVPSSESRSARSTHPKILRADALIYN